MNSSDSREYNSSNNSHITAPTMSAFFQDGNKSWFSFGLSDVDKTGRGPSPAWVPDDAVRGCTDCGEEFTFFNRRHHCRYCGRIFCWKCSNAFKMLPSEFGVREPQRVCTGCAAELEQYQEGLISTISNQTRTLNFNPDDISKFGSSPISFSMTAEIIKATHSVENFFGFVPNALIKDQSIPVSFLRQAKGIAFLSVIKAGFLFTGRIGTGLVVAKLPNGEFSAPSAIGTMGMGWGAQVGAEITDFVIILNTSGAVDAFSGSGQVSLGSELAVALGPLGRSSEADVNIGDKGIAPVFTYSQSKGFFAGISLEGAVIAVCYSFIFVVFLMVSCK